MKEELGVECDLRDVGYLWIEEGDNRERNEVFEGFCDGPFESMDDDVVGGEWFEVEWLKQNYQTVKVDPYFVATWRRWMAKGK